MKTNLLLPNGLKKVGWAILVPFLVLGTIRTFWVEPDAFFRWIGWDVHTASHMFTSNAEHWVNNILVIAIVIGAFFTTCSREKVEDEMTMQLRQQSLMLALWINYAFVILATLFIYDLTYVTVITYDMLAFLLLFLGIFRYRLWRFGKEAGHEE